MPTRRNIPTTCRRRCGSSRRSPVRSRSSPPCWCWTSPPRCASVTPPTRWPALPGVVPGPRLLARCMATLDTIATRLARCVELFRDPGAKQAQKAEFRALLGLLQDLPVTLTLAAGRLELNGVPCTSPPLTRLIQRLDPPRVGTNPPPQKPAPPPPFDLLTGLAPPARLADI